MAPLPIPRAHKLWLKARLLQARKRWVKTFRSYGDDELLQALQALGVQAGDSVLLHSAFGDDHGYRGTIDQLIQVFLKAVGPEGHLLMVSLPYRTSSIQYLSTLKRFDVRKTPSMMGLVSESFRRRPDVLRSLHPTHPVVVHGPRAEWFVAEHPDCLYPCGPGSPFDKLALMDGKAVFFNVPFAMYTFFHYLEHLVSPELPFALYTDDPFQVPVIDKDGGERIVKTLTFTPEAIARRRFPVFEAALREEGLIQAQRVGNTRIQAVRVRNTVDCVLAMSRRGQYFYEMPGSTPSDPLVR